MADRPILFSAPMVRALLDGKKTMTRRILNPQPYPLDGRPGYWNASGCVGGRICISDRHLLDLHRKPAPGDRLWCRETWSHTGAGVWSISDARLAGRSGAIYRADDDKQGAGWFPSIFMPREFSRLTLIVTDVRVQRLQEISHDDAEAEGIVQDWTCLNPGTGSYAHANDVLDDFRALWNSINGPDAWDANPWVAAYTFTVHRSNVDHMEVEAARV